MKRMSPSEIDREVSNLQAVLATRHIGYKARTTRAIAHELLLRGWYMYNGQGCNPIAKSVGCGVYEISLKQEND
jgi:hypothetical protein